MRERAQSSAEGTGGDLDGKPAEAYTAISVTGVAMTPLAGHLCWRCT